MQALKNLETLTKLKLKTLNENTKNINNLKSEDFNNLDRDKENSVSDGRTNKNVHYETKWFLNNDEENLATTQNNSDLQMQNSQTTCVHISTTSIM